MHPLDILNRLNITRAKTIYTFGICETDSCLGDIHVTRA